MVLETDRLLLKSPSCDFAHALLQYYNRNAAFLKAFEPKRESSFYTIEKQQTILAEEAHLQSEKSAYKFYIFEKDFPNALIGTVALSNIVRGCFLSCFIGYKLSEDYVNMGYMTEEVQKVTSFAFNDLNLHRIEGNVMPNNKPSLKVLSKCGFINEGISRKYLKINGVWEDHIHMVLLNERM